MGERSQIYIKWNVHANKGNKVGAIARYFQWNYGERMISRARGIIETLEEYMKYKYMFSNKWYIEKLTRIAETNFDMRDIVWSSNIIDEYNEYGNEDNFADIVFYGQDNNDGQLFIDITDSGIKYALALEYDENGYKPISAEQYMKENLGDYSESGDWRVAAKEHGYLDYTEDNIKYINENAELMTSEEIAQFIEGVRDIYAQPF